MTTSATVPTTGDDDRHTVATYVSDILALEKHINKPIEAQLNSTDHQRSPALTIIENIATSSRDHIEALEKQLDALGGSADHGVKSAWAQLIGGGAAALNNVRKTKVSKSLRDDYTALSLAAISYTMLHATASGLGDTNTAALAKRHLDDFTPLIVDISTAIPDIVLGELSEDNDSVDVSAARDTQVATADAWSAETTK